MLIKYIDSVFRIYRILQFVIILNSPGYISYSQHDIPQSQYNIELTRRLGCGGSEILKLDKPVSITPYGLE